MKRKSKSIGLYRYLFLPFTVLAVTNTTKQSSCDVSTCKSMVQWCLIKGGPAEIGKLKPQEDDNCRNCDPEAERKANNGECPCCERCARCLGDHYDDCCHCFGLCSIKPDKQMKISILHFEHNAEDTKTFKESTDIKLKNLFDVPFDVYHHDKLLDTNQPISSNNHLQVFWHDCMSYSDCTTQCQSMGSGHTRWFHSGCCECLDPRIQHLRREADPMCKNCISPSDSQIDTDLL